MSRAGVAEGSRKWALAQINGGWMIRVDFQKRHQQMKEERQDYSS